MRGIFASALRAGTRPAARARHPLCVLSFSVPAKARGTRVARLEPRHAIRHTVCRWNSSLPAAQRTHRQRSSIAKSCAAGYRSGGAPAAWRRVQALAQSSPNTLRSRRLRAAAAGGLSFRASSGCCGGPPALRQGLFRAATALKGPALSPQNPLTRCRRPAHCAGTIAERWDEPRCPACQGATRHALAGMMTAARHTTGARLKKPRQQCQAVGGGCLPPPSARALFRTPPRRQPSGPGSGWDHSSGFIPV